MKKILLLVLSISTLYTAKAQQPESRQQRIGQLSATFSAGQTKAAAIAAALDFNQDSIRAAARNMALTPKARQEQINHLEAERQAKIKSVLTPQQYAILQSRIAAQAPARKAAAAQRRQALMSRLKAKMEEQQEKKESNKP